MGKKLIEVALPLEAINRAAAAEKLIHVGTTSNLHAWWARRPLAACRAIAFASLVDDPGEYLPAGRAEAKRDELFRLIERLVQWESNNDDAVLETVRRELARSISGEMPTLVDPFCGSGSILVEALRLGLDAVGCDLNPIAVAVSKALVEVSSVVRGHRPIATAGKPRLFEGQGFEGFRADLACYSDRIAQRVREQVQQLYRDSYSDSPMPIAWLWCRTAECPNPACNTTIPLLSSLWLSKTKKSRAFLRVAGRDERTGRVTFDVVADETGEPGPPPLNDTGADCPICRVPVSFSALREQGRGGKIGFQLNAYVTKERSHMRFHAATKEHEAKALAVEPEWVPETKLPDAALGFRVQNYGLTFHKDLFLPRQLAVLCCFANSLGQTIEDIRKDAGADTEYANAIAVYLGLFFDRMVQTNNALVRWFVHRERPSKAQPTFDKQTVQMVWDFAETNPLSESTGGWSTCCKYPQTALDCLPLKPGRGRVVHGDSGSLDLGEGTYIFSTDPPYFDNIGYADLSDFFYIWLRRILFDIYPDVFRTILVPKNDEIVADPSRHGGDRSVAREFFYQRLGRVFSAMRRATSYEYPATIFYAFRQEESTDSRGAVSTGWEGMLQALIDARWTVTGTWPIRTEHANRPRGIGSNALASSIVLVSRPRAENAPTTARRNLVAQLKRELPPAVRTLQRGGIAPVDLAQAAIGPGMAVFSRFESVLEADGSVMLVGTALGLINQALDEVLAEQEGEFDPETRWAVAWFEQFGMNDGAFGVAETLSKAKNTAVNALAVAGLVEARGGRVRLLRRAELPADWDPTRDRRVAVWEVTQHLIRALEQRGEEAAATLLSRVGGLGDAARDLAYRLYAICEKKKWAQDALGYNSLVVAWPEISRLADRDGATLQGALDI